MIMGYKPTGEHISLKIGNLETVDDFCYLGSWVAESIKDIIFTKLRLGQALENLQSITAQL